MDFKKIVEDLRVLADDLEKMNQVEDTVKEETTDIKPETKEKKASSHSLEDVRGILAEKSQAGFTAQVRETISKFGANKLSEVSADVYDELYEAATKIGGEN